MTPEEIQELTVDLWIEFANVTDQYHTTMDCKSFTKAMQKAITIPTLILLGKQNYQAKDGTIKKGIEINGLYYALKDDLL
jgi:hypothetical protein